ncbi:signal transduction protein [Candidatus Magnetomorum sp. HK-1]|nr:signal transduction protein [Candidatus Magnetomorum sp. HK-1]
MSKVYISSTYEDLKDCRKEVYHTLCKLGHQVIAMENYVATDERPLDKCLKDVSSCDIYIGIFAWRYGFVPKGHEHAITEQEYRQAVKTKKRMLIFILDDKASWPMNLVDENRSKIMALRNELLDGYITGLFKDKLDLANAVSVSITQLEKDKNVKIQKTREEIHQDNLKSSYLNHLIKKNETLTLTRIDRESVKGENEMKLNSVYTALLTHSSEKSLSFEDDFIEEMKVDRGGSIKQASALEMLNGHQHLVLLGYPGGGKSTFVNFVACCMAGELLNNPKINIELMSKPLPDIDGKASESPQKWEHGPLLPVLIILRDFVARGFPEYEKKGCAKDLWRFIENELKNAEMFEFSPFMKKELRESGGIILLDGLDEVPDANKRREKLKSIIEDFISAFPKCHVLLTSRTYAYQKQGFRVSGMKEAVLAPFTEGQIKCFVDQWYGHIAELKKHAQIDAQSRAELLKNAIFNNPRLRELADRPLILTLMASLHAWGGGNLPENREALYKDTVDLLMHWWEGPKSVKDSKGNIKLSQPGLIEWLKTDRKQMRGLLNQLAYNAHASQPELIGTADISEDDLVLGMIKISKKKDIKPLLLIEYLRDRAGLLVSRGVGVYTFPHRTFQEYLAASYLTDFEYPEKVSELAKKNPERWREVMLLAGAKAASGSSSTIWSLTEDLCYLEPDNDECTIEDTWGAHLAAQVLIETATLENVSKKNIIKINRIKRWLIHIMRGNDLPAIERAWAGNALDKLGDPREEIMSVDKIQFCFVPEGDFDMGDNKKHPVTLSPYYISKYAVSNAQFNKFVKDNGYQKEHYWVEAKKDGQWKNGLFHGENRPKEYGNPFNHLNHPVIGVSWFEAIAFCRWLTEKCLKTGNLSKNEVIRLPTEAEWEKAAKGGNLIPTKELIASIDNFTYNKDIRMIKNNNHDRIYPWGNEIDSNMTNYNNTDIGATSSLGCFKTGVSPYGCEELAGNVWEWCMDWYGTYPSKHTKNPNGPQTGSDRVIRGGSWRDGARSCRAAFRSGGDPGFRGHFLGFRLLRTSLA